MIAELHPLLQKVAPLQGNPDADDIASQVIDLVNVANTDAMAQSACDKIIAMCHPKAWGDRFVRGYDEPWTAWLNFLGELSETANECGQTIYERHARGQ